MLVTLLATAVAASSPVVDPEPVIRRHADGSVEASLWLAADPSEVRRLLADAPRVAEMTPDVVSATAIGLGACEQVSLAVRGLFRPFSVVTERCPTADGWSETLIEGGVFTAWDSAWTVTPDDGGTRVTYQFRADLSFPVPPGLLQQRAARSLRYNLLAVADAVAP